MNNENIKEQVVDFFTDNLATIFLVFIVFGSITSMFVLAYLDGLATANYIKLVEGIDIPWWQAAFLDIEIFYPCSGSVHK